MKIYKLFILLILFISPFVGADSYYSAFGLGIPHYFVSPQAVGMGGAGIAVHQYLALNEMNPAGVYLNEYTMISVGYQGEIIQNNVRDASVTTRQGNASGFRFAIPISKYRIAILAGLKPLLKSEISGEFSDQYEEFYLTRSITTSGGISAASIGIKYSLFPWLHVGGLFNFNFGAYNEVWKTQFDNDTFINTTSDITSHLWGTNAELGIIYKPSTLFSFGGIVRTSSKLTIETTTVAGSGISLPPINQTAVYPLALGMGGALDFTKFLITSDIYMQFWEDYELDGQKNESLTNFLRAGAGIEYLHSKDAMEAYGKRVAYRFGASYAQLPFLDDTGKAAVEYFATFGIGFPFNKNAGRIDLSLEYGERRSSSDYQFSEELIRITAHVTSAEKWFQQLF